MNEDRITAVVVDDEQAAIDYMVDLLEEHKEIHLLNQFTDPGLAITEINKSKPDILFLDVQMPEKTGFDVIKEVRSETYLPYIIFTTGFEKFAIRAIKYGAFDYLLKPINPFELEAAIQKLINASSPTSGQQKFDLLFSEMDTIRPLKFNANRGFVVINPSDVIYLEASRNYCEIHLSGNRMELVSVNMFQVINSLPKTLFFRISRCHTVNMSLIQKVDRIKKECHLIANGEIIKLKISSDNIKKLAQVFPTNTSP